MRARYEQLAAAAASGVVLDDLLGALEALLEMLFDTGRVANRAMLEAVFSRTPRGRAQSMAIRDVNRALETLRGQAVVSVRIASAGPSQQSISIETDRCRLTVEVGRGGPSVSSLELG